MRRGNENLENNQKATRGYILDEISDANMREKTKNILAGELII